MVSHWNRWTDINGSGARWHGDRAGTGTSQPGHPECDGPTATRHYYDELRATVDDAKQHKEFVMRSSMITSLRELEMVE